MKHPVVPRVFGHLFVFLTLNLCCSFLGQARAAEVYQISAGFNHTCALTADGIKCWRNNDEGQTDVPPV
jgi:hypothetical protein